MSQIELNDFKHFHFIGIGGVGVSAVARHGPARRPQGLGFRRSRIVPDD